MADEFPSANYMTDTKNQVSVNGEAEDSLASTLDGNVKSMDSTKKKTPASEDRKSTASVSALSQIRLER